MSALPSSQGQGALFELVARGVKDKYFVSDQKDSEFIHDARYSSSLPHLGERRTFVPLNGTAFGSTFEVELDAYGDILTECALEIQLPTWIPPIPLVPGGAPVTPSVVNGMCPVTSVGGASYGYVNYAGYFLLEKVQFLQDQFLIQEWSGDGLLAKEMTEGSYHHGNLRLLKGGGTDTAERTPVRNLQLRATPGLLRVELPVVGCSGPKDVGLPLVGMVWQTLRLRVTLRRLEELVVCSDTGVFSPAPWDVPLFQYTMSLPTGQVATGTFAPLSLQAMGPPTVLLSTVQRYVTPEVQQEIREQKFEIPFRRVFENRFSFGELDFISLDKGGVSAVTRRLEGRHPTERLFWFFRLKESVDKGCLDNWTNPYFTENPTTEAQPLTWPYGGFYYRLKLLIAGKDREKLESGEVWDTIAPWAKAERAMGAGVVGLGMMDWGLGDRMGVSYPTERIMTGAVNMTTADRPTMYIELANIPTHTLMAQRVAEMRVFSEAWNVYIIEEGRGRVMFAA